MSAIQTYFQDFLTNIRLPDSVDLRTHRASRTTQI